VVATESEPGWYPNPDGSDDERYWDGNNWTPQRRDPVKAVESSRQPVVRPIHSEPPDWYPDPDGSGGERYWDGDGWTKRRRPEPTPLAETSAAQPTPRAVEVAVAGTKAAPDLFERPRREADPSVSAPHSASHDARHTAANANQAGASQAYPQPQQPVPNYAEFRRNVSPPAGPPQSAAPASGFRGFWLGLSDLARGWFAIGIIAAIILVVVALSTHGVTSGPSESYSWGERAGNSAVSLVRNGVGFTSACQSMIQAGSVWADDPILNPTPPPKNFNIADAQNGCLDQLHKRLGY
jgi:hypothetical protein